MADITYGAMALNDHFINRIHGDSIGERTIEDLRSHLAAVRHGVRKAGSSAAELKRRAKQDARGLLKIAQTGLKNAAGGSGEHVLGCSVPALAVSLSTAVFRVCCKLPVCRWRDCITLR